MIDNDISCIKYHYNVEKSFQNTDLNYAILKLSPDGKRLIIENLKLTGFNRAKEKYRPNISVNNDDNLKISVATTPKVTQRNKGEKIDHGPDKIVTKKRAESEK